MPKARPVSATGFNRPIAWSGASGRSAPEVSRLPQAPCARCLLTKDARLWDDGRLLLTQLPQRSLSAPTWHHRQCRGPQVSSSSCFCSVFTGDVGEFSST